MIEFTQGDTPNLSLTLTDGDGDPVAIPGGANLETFIRGPQGVIVVIPNGQHTPDPDQVNNTGQFTVALTSSNTNACDTGENKDILTQLAAGAEVTYYRAEGILKVHEPFPRQ